MSSTSSRYPTIEIRRPDDFHLHVRRDEHTARYLRRSARHFARVLLMPNTQPPILTAEDVCRYREEIEGVLDASVRPQWEAQRDPESSGERAASRHPFAPLYVFKLDPDVSPDEIACLAEVGVVAGKLYPTGSTTNAERGVRSIESIYPHLREMESRGLVLCIHAEDPSASTFEREEAYLPTVATIVRAFPKLRVVVEHLSTRGAVEFVRAMPPRVAATITGHHLLYAVDDLLGSSLAPHLFCKPVLKSRADRAALRAAAFSSDGRFFFGSDSAPHQAHAKLSPSGAAGVYASPTVLPLLAELCVDRLGPAAGVSTLDRFMATYGALFYGLPQTDERLVLSPRPERIADQIDGCIPLGVGRTITYEVEDSTRA